ncbi:hypothetical protein H8S20_11975 [Clostridium sp. NSJ-6]|uniref:Uncharacterized protein n=1 Tax=Clostridium hominis TaxID=2763036 RepID=A0ABR7DE14_9CLOT|nr:hypothetical protein [Clostridium hominis]MBC5629608.1 hypothetical protein [Clostridium hominis]MDU2673469.1 hypothetical protein [Clostridium sp.]
MFQEFECGSKCLWLDCDIVCELYKYSNLTIDDIISKIFKDHNEIIIDEVNNRIYYSIMLIEEDEYRVYYTENSREIILSMESRNTPGFTVIAREDNGEELAYICMELDEYDKL